MEVIVMKIERKKGRSMVTGVIGTSISPLAGNSLNEALGLAIGLRAIGFGEEVFELELLAGGGEEFGAISGAAIGEDALDLDAMGLVEVDGLMESVENAGGAFVGAEGGEGQAGVIVEGDVKGLDAGAGIAQGAITGGADARACEAAQLLDVEMEEVAGGVAFVAEDGRFWWLERSQAIESVTAQDARERSFGDREDHEDLRVRPALAAQGEDLSFQSRAGLAGLAMRDRGAIRESWREAGFLGATAPAAHGLFTDAISEGGGAAGELVSGEMENHLGSHQRGEFGISVHVVRAGGRWVECSSTTSLPNPCRADNVLKHDT